MLLPKTNEPNQRVRRSRFRSCLLAASSVLSCPWAATAYAQFGNIGQGSYPAVQVSAPQVSNPDTDKETTSHQAFRSHMANQCQDNPLGQRQCQQLRTASLRPPSSHSHRPFPRPTIPIQSFRRSVILECLWWTSASGRAGLATRSGSLSRQPAANVYQPRVRDVPVDVYVTEGQTGRSCSVVRSIAIWA